MVVPLPVAQLHTSTGMRHQPCSLQAAVVGVVAYLTLADLPVTAQPQAVVVAAVVVAM